MLMYNNNNKKVRTRANHLSFIICRLSFSLALLGLSASCSDWRDGIAPDDDDPSLQGLAISFQASVQTSLEATRADGSIVNKNETYLPATARRTYYVWDNDKGEVAERTTSFGVGIFGYQTGQQAWADVATPSPNFMYNQRMDIGQQTAQNTNLLSYYRHTDAATLGDSLQRFWPNNRLGSDATKYERVTFWAYYPWNATSDPGQYGISIYSGNDKAYGINDQGKASILFTMHPDAAEHQDFMVSDLVADCSRDQYPIQSNGQPKPVPLRFHHMLAQVRLYAFMRGTDKVVWATGTDNKTLKVTSISEGTATFSDGTTTSATNKYVDPWGKTRELAVGDSIPDDTYWLYSGGSVSNQEAAARSEAKTVRWQRTDITSPSGDKMRAKATLSMSFNNIHTQCIFSSGTDASGNPTFKYEDQGTLGSVTVNHYIQNPYWFHFDPKDSDRRIMLNDEYMYGFFEDTEAYDSSGEDDKLGYMKGQTELYKKELQDHLASTTPIKHYNYAPGNIILAVPQVMNDDDVPNIVITATGNQVTYTWNGSSYTQSDPVKTVTGKVTVNMLQMNLKWESGFIYSYAFVDELSPGDDKVRGPESITVIFDPTKHTDQW